MCVNRSALINGYSFEIRGEVKSRLAASFHFKVCHVATVPVQFISDECLGVKSLLVPMVSLYCTVVVSYTPVNAFTYEKSCDGDELLW